MNQQEAMTQFRKLIDSIPSVEFVEFVQRDEILDRLIMNTGLAEQEISQCGVGCEEVRWIKEYLTKLNIYGDILFSFYHPDNLFRYLPSARVHCILESDFLWVKQLWNLSHHFSFIPPDKSYHCQVMWDESAYKIFITYLKDIPKTDSE